MTIDIDADKIGEVKKQLSDGVIPRAIVDELVALRASAKASAQTYTDAITAQAEKHKLRKSALRRYINAREADKLADLDIEAENIATLLETAK